MRRITPDMQAISLRFLLALVCHLGLPPLYGEVQLPTPPVQHILAKMQAPFLLDQPNIITPPQVLPGRPGSTPSGPPPQKSLGAAAFSAEVVHESDKSRPNRCTYVILCLALATLL